MNPSRERDAVKAVLDLAAHPERISQSSVLGAVSYTIGAVVLLIVAIFFEEARYTSCFFIGIFLAAAYGRYTEAIGIRWLAPYLNEAKLKARYTELVDKIGVANTRAWSAFKTAILTIIGVGFGYVAIYVVFLLSNA